MDGFGGVAGLPFVVFANVEEDGAGMGGEAGARDGEADFSDVLFGFGDELEKSG